MAMPFGNSCEVYSVDSLKDVSGSDGEHPATIAKPIAKQNVSLGLTESTIPWFFGDHAANACSCTNY